MDIAELKRLLAEATPGPWGVSSERSAADHPAHVVSGQDYIADCEWRLEEQNDNAALIVAAVNALPDLLASADAFRWLADKASSETLTDKAFRDLVLHHPLVAEALQGGAA